MTGTHNGSRTAELSTDTGTDGGSDESIIAKTGSEIQHVASDKAGQLKEQLSGGVDSRREQLASTARTVQEQAQRFARDVREEQPQVGSALETVADSAGSVISYVERTPVDQMAHDLSTQMRRRPMLFAAGLFGAGFALARVIKPADGGQQRGAYR